MDIIIIHVPGKKERIPSLPFQAACHIFSRLAYLHAHWFQEEEKEEEEEEKGGFGFLSAMFEKRYFHT